jgi:hypothetical protein
MMTFTEEPPPPVSISAMCRCGVVFHHRREGQKVKCYTTMDHEKLIKVTEWTPRNRLGKEIEQ